MTTLAPNDFTHLHVHSEFSLLDGLGRITDLVDSAAAQGFDSLALTDHGALYGAVAFYQAAKAKGIKPIIGVETYVARRSMTEKEGKADAQPFHLILLARDLVGYRNLCRLVTDAHVDGYYYKPRIDREHLARYSEGLVGLSACLSGEIPRALEIEDWDSARRLASEYQDILGTDNFFLELQDHGLPEQRVLNEKLLRLAPETGLPLVVTNDLHYVHEVQSEAHDVLLCVGTGNNIDTPGRMKFDTRDFWLKSAAQMAALFPDHPEAILNSRRIAEMTDLTLPLGELRIPHFPVPDGETVETWLRKECERGLRERYGTVTSELQQRLDYELGVIVSMGYAGYFLIVADFVRFAREQQIQTTCRGSAPGSIVTYTLYITPVVSPEASSSNVALSSSGMWSRSTSTPRCSRMRSTALRRIVRFERPRKSNFSSPSASIPCISYWVMSASELVAFWSGISSVSGSREMTTPAACVDAFRATPSSCWASPTSLPICGSPSCISRSAGDLSASDSLMPSWFGTALAIRSTSP